MNSSDNQSAKKRIGEVASLMLDGRMNYLEGSLELLSLREDIGAYENDPDFFAFVAVAAEINSLPLAKTLSLWSDEEKERYQSEIASSINWAKEVSLSNCKSLALRYKI